MNSSFCFLSSLKNGGSCISVPLWSAQAALSHKIARVRAWTSDGARSPIHPNHVSLPQNGLAYIQQASLPQRQNLVLFLSKRQDVAVADSLEKKNPLHCPPHNPNPPDTMLSRAVRIPRALPVRAAARAPAASIAARRNVTTNAASAQVDKSSVPQVSGELRVGQVIVVLFSGPTAIDALLLSMRGVKFAMPQNCR